MPKPVTKVSAGAMAEESSFLTELNKKHDSSESLAKMVIQKPQLLEELMDGTASENPRVKFRSVKIMRIVSENEPELLYPDMDFFIDLLNSENNIVKWNAIDIIANLATVDSKGKLEKIFKKYYGLLGEGRLVTATHVVDNSWKIAKAKPNLQGKITKELLRVEKLHLPTEECRNIIIGKAIMSIGNYFGQIKNKGEVISFVKKQLNNPRNATRVKAGKLLKKIQAVP